MSDRGDHVPDMAPTRELDDDTIEAILVGDGPPAHGPLAAFAAAARQVGDRPPPRPSPELAHLLATGAARATERLPTPTDLDHPRRRRRTLARIAGLGVAAKIGLAATAAAAGVVGGGAAGMLSAGANRVVRDAIEVVTPLDFADDERPEPDGDGAGGGAGADDRGDAGTADASEPGEHGDRVSDDATGAGDGDTGVDGRKVSEDAPGASQRPTGTPGGDAPGPPAGADAPPVSVPPSVPGSSPPSTVPGPPATAHQAVPPAGDAELRAPVAGAGDTRG